MHPKKYGVESKIEIILKIFYVFCNFISINRGPIRKILIKSTVVRIEPQIYPQ